MSSNWKALNKSSASSAHKQKISKTKRKRYDPQRQDNQSNYSNRFKNQTLSRNQTQLIGMADDRSMHEMNKNDRGGSTQRVLKGCASQLKLRKQKFEPFQVKVFNTKNKNSNNIDLRSNQSGQIMVDDLNKKNLNAIINKGKYKDYSQQIRRIKIDFKNFQNIILVQLKKQQRMLQYLLQQIIRKVNKALSENHSNIISANNIMQDIQINKSKIKGLRINIQQERDIPIIKQANINKFYSPKNKIQAKNQYQSCPSESRYSRKSQKDVHRQRPSFDKFLLAMKNLKQDMAQISQISDISRIRSPRAQTETDKMMTPPQFQISSRFDQFI